MMFKPNQTIAALNRVKDRRAETFVSPSCRAFTRLDLVVTAALVLLLLTVFGVMYFGGHGKAMRCQANLRAMGNAIQDFATEHSDALPPAIIDTKAMMWDSQIVPYLPYKLVKGGIDPVFKCPSDSLPHARTRSYTMSGHNMRNENWPPGQDNATGVGLIWNQETITRLLGEPALKIATTNTDLLALVKRSQIPSPSETMVLTELINSGNNLKEGRWAAIESPGQQLEQLFQNGTRIHRGRYNYLMLDGHVELMSPLQAGDTYGNMKMWRISKSD